MYSDSRTYLQTFVWILSALQVARTAVPCEPLEVGPDGGPCVDMRWCLYKLYKNPRNWADARQICSQDGHDFLRVTDVVEHNFLTSFFQSSLGVVTPHPFDSTLWLGMQQNDDGVPRWHDDCATQPAGYNPVNAAPGANCFMFDISATTYTPDACAASKMFLCKAKSYDISTCFTTVVTLADATFTDGVFGGMTAAVDCAQKCEVSNCVGYRYFPAINECKMVTAALGNSYTKGAETDKFMKDIISATAVVIADPGAVTNEPCSSSAPAVIPEVTTTAVPEPTTTAVPEVTTTAIPEATTTADSGISSSSVTSSETGGLATSMGEMTTTQETSSVTTTPQLSNSITSVDLTTASLSTEPLTNAYTTGTPTTSCYHCFCKSNQMTSMSPEELQSQIETLKKELTVEKKDLSSWKRKLISAPDERVSAKGLGLLGAGMLAVVFGAVVVIDLPRFMKGLKTFYHSACGHKKVSTVE